MRQAPTSTVAAQPGQRPGSALILRSPKFSASFSFHRRLLLEFWVRRPRSVVHPSSKLVEFRRLSLESCSVSVTPHRYGRNPDEEIGEGEQRGSCTGFEFWRPKNAEPEPSCQPSEDDDGRRKDPCSAFLVVLEVGCLPRREVPKRQPSESDRRSDGSADLHHEAHDWTPSPGRRWSNATRVQVVVRESTRMCMQRA